MEQRYCLYCMSPMEGSICPSCGHAAADVRPLGHHLPPGTVLESRYLVGRAIGEGGFGITYIGLDTHLELKVAIKEYYPTNQIVRDGRVTARVASLSGPQEQSFAQGKKKFLAEALVMAKLSKARAVVHVEDFFEANGTAYIVMEFVDGVTFSELVERDGPIPPARLLPMMEPLFQALSAMHENGLIHRDISPDNIMLENGSVRLLDFGCAREAEDGSKTLTIALKHGYAPVEQYWRKGQGPWTDVYALSATIYFCLTGVVPPRALDRMPEDAIQPPGALGIALAQPQEQALLKGLRIQPRRRFRTMETMRAALYEGKKEVK